jgi:hypothetical protein
MASEAAMSHPDLVPSNKRIMETVIELTRLSKSHRVIVAGSNAFDIYLGLLHRGFGRAATTATCRVPCEQHHLALVMGEHSIRAFEAVLVRIVPFLNTRATMAVWVDADQHHRGKKLQLLLERLGVRIEAGAKCATGFVLAAQRRERTPVANAA